MCDAVGLHLMNEKGTEDCWSTDSHLGLTGVHAHRIRDLGPM